MAYVYKHIKKDTNEIFYIGISNKNYNRMTSKWNRTKLWHNIVKKHDYVVEIIIDDISFTIAKELEIGLIEYYGRVDLGTGKLANMTVGGDGVVGNVMTKESRDKISKARKGNPLSAEHKEKLRLAQLGRKYSDTAKKKMSDASIGKSKSESHRQNISKGGTGIKRTEKFKEHLRELYKNKTRNEDFTWKHEN